VLSSAPSFFSRILSPLDLAAPLFVYLTCPYGTGLLLTEPLADLTETLTVLLVDFDR
jgi:hypothetical protein